MQDTTVDVYCVKLRRIVDGKLVTDYVRDLHGEIAVGTKLEATAMFQRAIVHSGDWSCEVCHA